MFLAVKCQPHWAWEEHTARWVKPEFRFTTNSAGANALSLDAEDEVEG